MRTIQRFTADLAAADPAAVSPAQPAGDGREPR
jgi:hypothetical protein